MVKLTPEIMLKRFMRGRAKHLYSEMRIQFQMRLWDEFGMRIYELIEDDKIRVKINLILKDCLVKTFRFINNVSEYHWNKGQRTNKEIYVDTKTLDLFKSENNEKIEDIIFKYGFKGVEKTIAIMIMEGYNDSEIKDKLSISNHYYQLKKNKIKNIIKESNDV